MEKEFFDVFPNLKVKDQLHEWLEMVTVSKVSCNPAKTRLWVYIHSERWIHKKYIMALEDQIERQCFSGLEIQVTVIERFHLVQTVFPGQFSGSLSFQYGSGTEELSICLNTIFLSVRRLLFHRMSR